MIFFLLSIKNVTGIKFEIVTLAKILFPLDSADPDSLLTRGKGTRNVIYKIHNYFKGQKSREQMVMG